MTSLFSLIRNAYGGLSREVWLLSFTQFINRSGTMVVFFLSVYLKDELHFNLTRVGVAMAFFGAGSFAGTYAGGKLTDSIGPHKVMRWSLLLGGLLFFVVAQIDHFYPLCIGLFLLSAVGDAFRPANMASIFHYSTPETYTRSVALNRLAINLGFSIGPAIGGLVVLINYKLIFWLDGVTCILAAGLIVFFLKDKLMEANTNKKTKKQKRRFGYRDSRQPMKSSVPSPWKDSIYMLFLPLSVLYAMTFFQFFSTMQLYYKEVEMLSETQIGLLLTLNGLLVAGIEIIMISKIEKLTSKYNYIALGALLLVVSYILLLFVSGWWWMVVLTITISFSEMFAMPFMMALMNARSTPKNKGQYASLYNMSWSAGQILIPLVATQTIEHFSYSVLWIILAVLSLWIAVGIKRLERRELNAPTN